MALHAVPDKNPPVLDESERAEKAAALHASGWSYREITQAMELTSPGEAKLLADAGKLVLSRLSADDIRADHLALIRRMKRKLMAVVDSPQPLLNRLGDTVTDEEGYALGDQNVLIAAGAQIIKLMEREARLAGADAPVKSQNLSVSVSAEQMRSQLAAAGIGPEAVTAMRNQILAITSGQVHG